MHSDRSKLRKQKRPETKLPDTFFHKYHLPQHLHMGRSAAGIVPAICAFVQWGKVDHVEDLIRWRADNLIVTLYCSFEHGRLRSASERRGRANGAAGMSGCLCVIGSHLHLWWAHRFCSGVLLGPAGIHVHCTRVDGLMR